MQSRPSAGISALVHMSRLLKLCLLPSIKPALDLDTYPVSYLKPIEMIKEKIDSNFFFHNDTVGCTSLPIPGIINQTNQRVYIYLLIVDMLQTYDSVKHIEQTFKKIKNPHRHLQYSVIEPDEYEKTFSQIFISTCFY